MGSGQLHKRQLVHKHYKITKNLVLKPKYSVANNSALEELKIHINL